MYDFDDVISPTKTEQIRAWSVERAIESLQIGDISVSDAALVQRALIIENFVLNGQKANKEVND